MFEALAWLYLGGLVSTWFMCALGIRVAPEAKKLAVGSQMIIVAVIAVLWPISLIWLSFFAKVE